MKKNVCNTCGFFYQYYTKSYNCFNKTRIGKCKKKAKITDYHDSCELWQDNTEKREMQRFASMATLAEISQHIKELTQILRENSIEK